MPKLEIKISKNAKLVRDGLKNLDADIPKVSRLELYNTMLKIQKELQKYPPPPPKSKYIRTFKLRAGWTVLTKGKSPTRLGYSISNKVKYATLVMGDEFRNGQAWMHKGRWPLFKDVVEKMIDKLPTELNRNINLAARAKNIYATNKP